MRAALLCLRENLSRCFVDRPILVNGSSSAGVLVASFLLADGEAAADTCEHAMEDFDIGIVLSSAHVFGGLPMQAFLTENFQVNKRKAHFFRLHFLIPNGALQEKYRNIKQWERN